jgi:hypothetical protein
MGTDIEVFTEQQSDESWHFAGQMESNSIDYNTFHDIYDDVPLYIPSSIYSNRNYNLFAILADVRNDYDEKFEPISPLRGLPDNLPPELAAWYTSIQTGEEGETLSLDAGWLTLEELANFDWHGKRRTGYGCVDDRVAHLFHPDRPFPWDAWPADVPPRYSRSRKNSPYRNAIWTDTYADAVGPGFMQDVLAQLLKSYGASNNVRLVFDFAS